SICPSRVCGKPKRRLRTRKSVDSLSRRYHAQVGMDTAEPKGTRHLGWNPVRTCYRLDRIVMPEQTEIIRWARAAVLRERVVYLVGVARPWRRPGGSTNGGSPPTSLTEHTTMTNENGQRSITITLTERQWRGLQFEARLLSQVFAQSITPADL